MSQANKKIVQFSQSTSSNHPLIDISQDAPEVTTKDNLCRAHDILALIQGLTCTNNQLNLSTKATSGLYWVMECANKILMYEYSKIGAVSIDGNPPICPANPLIDDTPADTLDRLQEVHAILAVMLEIDEVDKTIAEGMIYILNCVDHALEQTK